MTDAERLRRAIEEDCFVGNMAPLLRDEVIRLRKERDAILRWSIKHAGYISQRPDDGQGSWWARGDDGNVYGRTAEEAIRKAAGLEAPC